MNLKKMIKILLSAGLLLILVLIVLWQLLPGYLDSNILPGLAAQNGVEWQSGRIRTIRLTGFDAGGFVIGSDNKTGVSVDAVHVDYTPLSLLRKRINRIAVSGLTLNVEFNDEGVAVSGLELNKSEKAEPKAVNKGGDTAKKEPVQDAVGNSPAIDRFEISNAMLNISGKHGEWQVPFSLGARLAATGEIEAIMTLYLCGQKIMITTRWSQADSNGSVSLAAESISIEKMMAMLKAEPGLAASGDVEISAGADISMSPFELKNVVLSLASKNLAVVSGETSLEALSDDGRSQSAFNFMVRQTGKNKYVLTGGNLMVRSAVPLVLDDLQGVVSHDANALTVELKTATRLPAFGETAALPVKLEKDARLTTKISGRYAFKGDWQFSLANVAGSDESIVFSKGQMEILSGLPDYRLDMQGSGAKADGQIRVSIKGVGVDSPSGSLKVPLVVLQGRLGIENADDRIIPRAAATLKLSDIHAEIGPEGSPPEGRVSITQIEVPLQMHGGDASGPKFTGEFRLMETGMSMHTQKVGLSGMTARIPWQWPAGESAGPGHISIPKIRWKHLEMGALEMTVEQEADGVAIAGRHLNTQLPELELTFSAAVDFVAKGGAQTRVEAFLARPDSAPEIDLGRFDDGGEGIYFKGALGAEIGVSFMGGDLSGSACVRIDRAAVRMPEKGVNLENLSLGLCFPDLPALESGPSQVLSFDKLSAGGTKLDGGIIHFQLEPYNTLFVEKGQVKWCQGKIRLQPMRITPGIDEYETRLDCDRLNLAQILGQIGVANAQGEGAVNGTIPVSIKKGRVRFDDGFLYSTPGSGGKIRLSGADTLLAGIPKGTRQYFQVDLAKEALKDFYYNWAKLRIVSEEETLRMRLQFDGKPSNILPFEYDETFGGFIRVDADSQGSEFEGITLDVNFRVPLNDLLEHRELLELFKQN